MPSFITSIPVTTRPLTPHEEQEIIDWCRTNPKGDLKTQVSIWMETFNCSSFSINKALMLAALADMPTTQAPETPGKDAFPHLTDRSKNPGAVFRGNDRVQFVSREAAKKYDIPFTWRGRVCSNHELSEEKREVLTLGKVCYVVWNDRCSAEIATVDLKLTKQKSPTSI